MTIHETGTDVLAAIVAAYEAADVALPERRYVTSGDVAIDCEQVVVSVNRIFPGIPGAEITSADLSQCRGPRVQVMQCYVVRCVPTPEADSGESYQPPSPAELDASAAELLADAGLLSDGLIRHLLENQTEWGDRRAWRVGDLNSYGPEGGFGGWRVLVEVAI